MVPPCFIALELLFLHFFFSKYNHSHFYEKSHINLVTCRIINFLFCFGKTAIQMLSNIIVVDNLLVWVPFDGKRVVSSGRDGDGLLQYFRQRSNETPFFLKGDITTNRLSWSFVSTAMAGLHGDSIQR